MKRRNIQRFSWACLLGCALAVLPSCSDDNDAPVAPQFPENVETLSFQAAGEQDFTFTANTDWALSSSKLWCKFKSGEESVQSLMGTAGEQTVTVVVDETLWGLEDATADLTLTMGGQTKAIATVTRTAQGIAIEGVEKVTIAYTATGATATVAVKANFDWELTAESLPQWMDAGELPRKGYAGRAYEVPVSVKAEYIPYVQAESTLTFFQSGAEGKISIPVEYAGMPDEAIQITAPERAFGWYISADGQSYSQGSLAGEETEKLHFPMDIQVMTKNQEYEVVRFVSSEFGLVTPDPWAGNDFFKVEDKGNGKLVMNAPDANTGAEREGFVLIVPKDFYASLGNDPDKLLEEDFMDVKQEYQRYVVFQFTQESGNTASGGFIVKDALNPEEVIECFPSEQADESLQMYIEYVASEVYIDRENIYYAKVAPNTRVQINPQLTSEQWDPSAGFQGMNIKSLDGTGSDLSDGWAPNMPSDAFVLEGAVKQHMYISFPDNTASDGKSAKALIFIVEE